MESFPMIRHILTVTLFTASFVASAIAQVPPIPRGNHYTCYPARFTDEFKPRVVTLTDQMGTYRAEVIGLTRICMPARKVLADKVSEPVDPRAHLTCYAIRRAEVKLTDVITND